MKYISIALAVILSACSGLSTKTSDNEYDPTQEKPEFYLGGFDGVWVGDVQQIKGHNYPFVAKGDSKFSMMLVIRDQKVNILTGAAGKPLREIQLGKINITKHKTNAVIYAQHSESKKLNEEDTGEWVETWNMTLTLKEEGSVYIYLVRAVNNFLLSHDIYNDKETARFFYSWSGELNQIASIQRVTDEDSSDITYPKDSPLNVVPHEYPAAAYDNNIEGHCIVTFDINPSGHTENWRIVPGDCKTIDGATTDVFTESSLNATKQFEFLPKLEDGKPVYRIDQTYKFNYRINK